MNNTWLEKAGIFALTVASVMFFYAPDIFAAVRDEISRRQQQIEELRRQIEAYESEIQTTRSKSRTLQNEISILNAKINQLILELKNLDLSIRQASSEIGDTQNKILVAEDKLQKHRAALADFLQSTYETDHVSLTQVLLKHDNLSGFLNTLQNLEHTQGKIKITISDIKNLKNDLQQQKEQLESRKADLEQLRALEEIEKRNVDQNKLQKDRLLKETKGQESKYQELVKKSQQDIQRLQEQIFYLSKQGVTAEDAIKYGHLAANMANIRPAFLIAILEIESGLGRNVGTGNWMDDMYNCYKRLGRLDRAEREKAAFLEIASKLGLDPNSVKVSREPNYGCGGALGPAQFIATTWLAYEKEVARLTGHNPPNPWNIEDAFMASAIKLARGGATSKDRAGEIAAAKAYISGNSRCASNICNSYSAAVLRKASAIEPNL